MNELALFAGAGGGILGGKLLGWRTVCAVEWDAYARDVLVARQNDGMLDPFPIWDDVQTFDGQAWRGCVDVVSGGFPCQDISSAGKGAGIEGERSGMWRHMARIIGEVRPGFVLVENSPLLVRRGLAMVLGDLAEMGYDAKWGVLGAHHVAAPHKRDRIWIVAHDTKHGRREGRKGGSDPGGEGKRKQSFQTVAHRFGEGLEGHAWNGNERNESGRVGKEASRSAGTAGLRGGEETVADSDSVNRKARTRRENRQEISNCNSIGANWWESEPDVGRVAHGVAARVDRLRCIGDGQVPAVAALAWEILTEGLTEA